MRQSMAFVLGLALIAPMHAAAQDEAVVTATEGARPFAELYAQWKQLLASMRELRARYQAASPDQRAELRTQYDRLLAQADQQEGPLLRAAEAEYTASPDNSGDAARFLAAVAQDRVVHDDYEIGLRLTRLLIDHDYPEPGIYPLAAIAASAIGEYDLADKYFAAADDNNALNEQSQAVRRELPEQRQLWQREQELRQAQAQADDLPRVVLKTTKGDITLELFENEAPNTVANFINLVEKKFYDGLSFHRVLGGFMMQGGCPKGDGTGGPGYVIDCESDRPEHRDHFRGSLSMAHAGRNTGGSQFFITFRPTLHLNGKHTVFGRVIDGMDVLADIKRRDPNSPEPPDRIVSAVVVRKRNHEYTPVTKPDPRG